ncbi:MAG: hypothetical protein ACI8UO_004208 [Verrucomicrobiales bacterium]|jgi:hypothetical protein
MRTTVDIPDSLMARVKNRIHKQGTTFRTLVISALENAMEEDSPARDFQMRDASVGSSSKDGPVTSDQINAAIDGIRDPESQP